MSQGFAPCGFLPGRLGWLGMRSLVSAPPSGSWELEQEAVEGVTPPEPSASVSDSRARDSRVSAHPSDQYLLTNAFPVPTPSRPQNPSCNL